MLDRKEGFYLERDKRTSSFVNDEGYYLKEIGVLVSKEALLSETGQLLLFSTLNQLSRVHRRIKINLEIDVHVLLSDFPKIEVGKKISDEIISLLTKIDPFGDFKISDDLDSCFLTISIGNTEMPAKFYVGCRGTIGFVNNNPNSEMDWTSKSKLGSAIASTLISAAVFRTVSDYPVRPIAIDSWNMEEVGINESNYVDSSLMVPLLGDALIIGGGAVGSAFCFWLNLLGFKGNITIIDKDEVKLHNTNRSPIFFPEQTSFFGSNPLKKVDVIDELLGSCCKVVDKWYDEASELNSLFDIIYCLANERDVRTRILSRYPVVTLHATTGKEWVSELHRHIYGKDDCIRCRMNDIREIEFECSTIELKNQDKKDDTSSDAALPFLSITSALMLYIYSIKIGLPDELETINNWKLYFDFLPDPIKRGRQKCKSDCLYIGKEEKIKKIQRENLFIELL